MWVTLCIELLMNKYFINNTILTWAVLNFTRFNWTELYLILICYISLTSAQYDYSCKLSLHKKTGLN